MSIEEEYSDVLQNLEEAIIAHYRDSPELIDAEVETAISYLVKFYSAEVQGKTSSYREPKKLAKEVAQSVKQMCEWRLGREKLEVEDESGQITQIAAAEMELELLKSEQIVACLKRIQSSIKFWSKKHGRQGYLNFVLEFM